MNWQKWLSDTAKEAHASDIRELLKLTAQPDMISLAGGLPDSTLFPLSQYQEILAKVLEQHGAAALQYSPTEGVAPLREAVSALLGQEGIRVADSGNLLFTSGSQQALELLGQAFINPGDVILVEAPTYVGALQAFNPRKPRYEQVAMDGQGLQVEQLQERISNLKQQGLYPKLLYTVPTFQNPTGATLTLARRQALLELAEREDFVIVEDDPYSQLRFIGEAVPSLKNLASAQSQLDERVILIRTFSKTIAPSLRTGYVVGSAEVLRRMAILKQGADLCSSALNQFVLYDLLQANIMQGYVQKASESYGSKAKAMSLALGQKLKAAGVTWVEPEGGMFLWLQLPAALDAGELLKQAIAAKVAYVKGAAFYPDGATALGRHSMRLNFSSPSLAQIEIGIERLSTAILSSLEVVGVA
jgi:2-aminoadipate transaminase